MKRNLKNAKASTRDSKKKLRLVREIVVAHLEGVQGGNAATVGPCSACADACAD